MPPDVFHVKGVLKNFANFTEKHLCWSECLFNKETGLKACNFIKKRLQHSCSPVKSTKLLRTPIIAEHYFEFDEGFA